MTSDYCGTDKTTFITNFAKDLLERETEKFSTDFSKNKEIVDKLADIKSKRTRNIVEGYITAVKGRGS